MRQTPRQIAEESAEQGRKIARVIDDAIHAERPLDADLLTIYAHRVRLCNQTGNIWTAADLHNDKGDCFDGSGRFWFCGSKMCPYCLARQSQRNRKKLRAAILQQRVVVDDERSPLGLPVGQNYHFLTLTMPNIGLPIIEARAILNLAWSLFRKKDWFRKTIVGGAKSEEFTLTARGYHYHAHSLVRSRYINYSSLRHYWTESLRVAFSRYGKTLDAATSDHLAIANCRRVGSIEDAIKEVAKYMTKSTSWQRIDAEQLLDLCRIIRWPRMFELFGSFRLPPAVAALEVDEDIPNKTILDTKSLSDGEPETGWRTTVNELGVAAYLEKLDEGILSQAELRMRQLRHHYKYAKFVRLRPEQTVNNGEIVKRIAAIYSGAGRPPPPTVLKYLDFDTRVSTAVKFRQELV